MIVDLYLTCENDFLDGLEIFEAIVEKQILDTSKEQIKELEMTIENTLEAEPNAETNIPKTTSSPIVGAEEDMAELTIDSPEEAAIDVTKTVVATDNLDHDDNSGSSDQQYSDTEIEGQMLENPNTNIDMEDMSARLRAVGGGAPKGLIVGGVKFMNI